MVQLPQLLHLGRHHLDPDQIHPGRLAPYRSDELIDVRERSAPDASDHPAVSENARHQSLRHAVHLAIPFDDHELCMDNVYSRFDSLYLQPLHPPRAVGLPLQGSFRRRWNLRQLN